MKRRKGLVAGLRSGGSRAKWLRSPLVSCLACVGAAAFALMLSLILMSVVVLLIATTGDGGAAMSKHPLHVALEDGAVLLYMTQLVSLSFFHHTAGLRIAPLPGLALVALAIGISAMLVTKLVPGPSRRRMLIAALIPIPYALLSGLAARVLPLRLTGPIIGSETPVQPAILEAFLLPLAWGLLFAPLGGTFGVFGRRWRQEGARMLRAWAAPVRGTARALAMSVALAFLVVVAGGIALAGTGLSTVMSGGFAHAALTIAGLLIALPTLVATTLLASFGVSFEWRLDALTRSQGSGSIFGGALPSTSANAHQVPGLLVLLLFLAPLTVGSVGWLTAKRSQGNLRLILANALRAGVLMTMVCWLLGLVGRVDAQAGGFLGIHVAAETTSLLWRVPVWCLFGSLGGSLAYVLTRGPASRRRLMATLRAEVGTSAEVRMRTNSPYKWRQGVGARAALGVSFLSLPAMLVGIGPAGATTSVGHVSVSLAPLVQAAEGRLRRDAVPGEPLAVTINPSTRAVDTASVRVPLHTLGIAAGQSPILKAKAVLAHYGDLFGLTHPSSELGEPKEMTNPLAKTDRTKLTHVYFKQMINGVPVFTGGIGIHFSTDGQYLAFVSGSIVPEVSVKEDKVVITSGRAVALAKAALPTGQLVESPTLQVYAGRVSRPIGPAARLAWFVWLMDPARKSSTQYVVDAVTGAILNVLSKTEYSKSREVYNAKKETTLPGTIARKEGEGATGDADIDHAYEYTGDVFNYYYEVLGRESYDNRGATLTSSAHYGKEYQNAFWNGKQMVFGDGYASALDVVGHELTHAVTEATANEVEEGVPGSINEGFSDSMGEWIEYETNKSADWLMGENLPIKAIRSLKEPKIYSELTGLTDPEKLSEYRLTCQDSLGVHENSTILSHAFYLLATSSVGVQAAGEVWYHMQAEYMHEHSTFEDARAGALEYAKVRWGTTSTQYKEVESAFNTVGLNGSAEAHAIECGISFECSFLRALQDQQAASGTASTLGMLGTLYRARGELAQSSPAGRHFMPLYEENMGRITELVASDPTLEEMAVSGLQEITPALTGLIENEGNKFKLSKPEMARIEAALKRLAQDDRIYNGGGPLANLIERELKWLRLPTYSGMTYSAGFTRLNNAVLQQGASPPPPATFVVDPQCTGKPYSNEFEIHAFHVDTPGHYLPGEISPLVSSGVACGTSIEKAGTQTECRNEKTLNTKMALELPPGDKVNTTTTMTNGSWVGEAFGRAIACAGSESRIIYGGAGIKSVKSWTAAQCPVSAIACYEGEATYEGHPGHSYSWVTEAAERLTLTTGPVEVEVEGHKIPVGFSEFGVKLCARVGEPGTKTCGTSTAAPWVHKNGTASQPNCPTANGLFVARVSNVAGSTTPPARSCVQWGEELHKQTIDTGNNLTAVSCIPGTLDCVATDNKGNALYSSNVSATASSTWTSWAGPTTPGEAIACPTTTLCTFGDGTVSGSSGGNLYYAKSLGGAWSEAFKPSAGVLAVSCASASFCVTAQDKGGISYSTNPPSTSWSGLSIGTAANNAVSCLSASFCTTVDSSGNIHVANSEAHVKEAAGWKATNIDGTTSLHGVACSATTSCIAVDGAGDVLNVSINGSAEATAVKHDIDGTNNVTAVTCTKEFTCVAVDSSGNIFVSTTGGESWAKEYTTSTSLTSVACTANSLCVTVDTSGNMSAFHPNGVLPNYTQAIDATNSINAVACVPATSDCVATDSKGNALYATNVNLTSAATWTSWTGPASPSEAISCPATSLCALGDGKVSEGTGGSMYYATSLGGAWKEAFSPAFGVLGVSCPTATFCVDSQEGGFIRYSTAPASTSWTSLNIGTTSMNSVFCLSASFCAVGDASGHVWIANTEARVKEVPGWKSTDVDGTAALHGVACVSTIGCIAIDGAGNAIKLTINSTGEATAATQNIDGTNDLTAVTCTTGLICATVDAKGNIFVSNNGGETWSDEHTLGSNLTSVACSLRALCVAGDTTGNVTAFEAE